MLRLDKRRDELWLEVDQWTSTGWKRFVRPKTLKDLLRSCSDLLMRVDAVREQLRRESQVPSADRTDFPRNPPSPSPSPSPSSRPPSAPPQGRSTATTMFPSIPQFYFFPLMPHMRHRTGRGWSRIPDESDSQDITDAIRGPLGIPHVL